jgi:hypothetical protein
LEKLSTIEHSSGTRREFSHTAGVDSGARRLEGARNAGNSRAAGEATEAAEVPLGPSIVGGTVLVGKLGGFKQNAVALGTSLSRIGTEEKQA